jgi:site-specific DNA-methyltransferase (adenine-specific)
VTAAQAGFALRGRNPDVLTCIANLSNDEVFTPPEFANKMLDTLAEAWAADNHGANIWTDPSVTFLDPVTKSGVFLREITSRLTDGLKDEIPDLHKRVDHILTKQVFGIGITHLTSLLARRSVYCSKFANGPHSIVKSFTTEAGNIWFERLEHTWTSGRCQFCGASQKTLDRGEGLETHAYAFIHTHNIRIRLAESFGDDMQFDVIIGNPPYQLDDGGYGTSATPIYHLFVEKAFDLDPRYVVMVTPSRWFAGGKGLGQFRERMLSDRRLRNLVDYPKLYDGFPGVKIRGGISYFLWGRDYDGPCTVQTMWDGKPVGETVERFLGAYDVLVRWNQAVSILDKVTSSGEPTLDARVSSRKPFGLPTNFHGNPSPAGLSDPVQLYGSQKVTWVDRSTIPMNGSWIDDWKVLMTAVQGTSAAVETKFLSRPILAGPGTACSETYLVAGRFDGEIEARRYAAFLRTRFVRFLVSLRKQTQHATRDVYGFVPDLPLDQDWTDAKLYDRYGLTEEEIAFIESQVAEHNNSAPDEVVADNGPDE